MSFTPRFNPQLKEIEVSLIRAFDEKASQIPGILKLTLGEPDFNTPEAVKKAGIKGIEENFSHYSPNRGLLELRKAACEFVEKNYHIQYHPETEVLTTIGATEALATSLLGIIEPGDVVFIPTPNYPGYEPLVTLAGGKVVYLDTTEDNFVLKPEKLKAAVDKYGEKSKALLLNTPSNPTGVVYPKEAVENLATYLKETNLFVISDEVYSELTYDLPHTSIGEYLKEQSVVINGLSKSHAMTGWRLGFLFTSETICQELVKVHQYLVTAASTISQKAAIEALTHSQEAGKEMKKAYQKRRDYLVDALKNIGFELEVPQGAFYLFVKIPEKFTQDSFAFCLEVAEKAKLALIPGIAFGKAGEGYFRISYASSMEDLKEAVRRLTSFIL